MSNKPIEVKIDKKDLKILQKTAIGISDTKWIHKVLAKTMLNFVQETFKTEGENIGEPWQEWSDEWEKLRTKLDTRRTIDGEILQFKGDLYNSISRKFDTTSAIVGVGGSAKDYAAIQNFGGKTGKNKSVNMPARPYLIWSEPLTDEVLGELKYQILKKYPEIKNA